MVTTLMCINTFYSVPFATMFCSGNQQPHSKYSMKIAVYMDRCRNSPCNICTLALGTIQDSIPKTFLEVNTVKTSHHLPLSRAAATN